MGVLEVVLSAVVCAVAVVAVGRIAAKAGYSPWWALVPAVAAAVTYVMLAAAHSHARFGSLSLHTALRSSRALVIADAACLSVLVVLLVAFAVSDWPMLAGAQGHAASPAAARRRGRSSARAKAAATGVEMPARLRTRALPDVAGQPAGWFASGALGSGEQSYWDGTRWTAKRCWRNEMWIDQPLETSLLAEATR